MVKYHSNFLNFRLFLNLLITEIYHTYHYSLEFSVIFAKKFLLFIPPFAALGHAGTLWQYAGPDCWPWQSGARISGRSYCQYEFSCGFSFRWAA